MNVTVSLTQDLAGFVEAQVSAGRYRSSEDVLREALRQMAEVERQDADETEALRHAWKIGLESGDAGELDLACFKLEARAQLAASDA